MGKNQYNSQWDAQWDTQRDTQCRDAMHCVSTNNGANTNANTNGNVHKTHNQFGPQSKNLASIIRGFKIGVTKNARIIQPNFAWQSPYHDHFIRDDKSFHTISEYIIRNPKKWSDDKFYFK